MARVSVDVNPSVLEWALERARVAVSPGDTGREPAGETARLLQQKLPKWLDGSAKPTLPQLRRFAKATYTPLGYFFLDAPPTDEMPLALFRSGAAGPSGPSPHMLDTIHTMQRRQEWMREHLIEDGHASLPFVASAGPDNDVTSVAGMIRRALGLSPRWAAEHDTWEAALKALRSCMENAGILVVANGVVGNNTRRPLDPAEFRGFVLVDDYAPLVFVNGCDWKAAQMFTLAHELAHVFLGSEAAFDLHEMRAANDPTERACDAVAAEFLVPEAELRQRCPSARVSRSAYAGVARDFKVSRLVAARRLLDLELTDPVHFRDFYRDYQNGKVEKPASDGGGNFYATQNARVGIPFMSAVTRALDGGTILYKEAFELTGLRGATFDQYASRVTGEGRFDG